ncbi:hypothetical protein [Streptomyces sp. NPDC060035]
MISPRRAPGEWFPEALSTAGSGGRSDAGAGVLGAATGAGGDRPAAPSS